LSRFEPDTFHSDIRANNIPVRKREFGRFGVATLPLWVVQSSDFPDSANTHPSIKCHKCN
jgi:hypothetical protein